MTIHSRQFGPSRPAPSDCDCCSGTGLVVPRSVANPPGGESLHYRVGTYAEFVSSMKALLSELEPIVSPNPLDRLRTRSTADPAIALLDAWAIVADVLSFYQERI